MDGMMVSGWWQVGGMDGMMVGGWWQGQYDAPYTEQSQTSCLSVLKICWGQQMISSYSLFCGEAVSCIYI